MDQRTALAATYRAAPSLGLDDLLQVHFSVRLADEPGRMLLNPFGRLTSEITPSSLIEAPIGLDPAAVADLPLNPAGYMIHSAVYRARADVQAVMHCHSQAAIAVSCLEEGLLQLSQYATLFAGDWGFHAYDGIVVDRESCASLQASLGARSALLLRNHGSLVVGPTLPQCLYLSYYLEQACRIQMMVLASGRPYVLPDPELCLRARAQLVRDGSIGGAREFAAILRRLDQTDPSYRS
jgi:ribulose-5-phosphate 4-epimerase/fuculose-1-phosphate aldolase